MTLRKPARIEDEELLEFVRSLPCISCGGKGAVTHPHHVKTKKSGGPDLPENLMPLCPTHHMEVHRVGLKTFAETHPSVLEWLRLANWELDLYGRWRNEFNQASS